MENVVTLEPLPETIEFSGAAERKVVQLIGEMIITLKRFEDACDTAERDQAYGELKRLQEEQSAAQARVAFLQEALDAANDDRRSLWDTLPNGRPCLLVARRTGRDYIAVMAVKRCIARIDCSELYLFEPIGSEVRLVA